MSHIKFNSAIRLTTAQEKIAEAKIERFSDAVTLILQSEAAAKMKKLVYVFIGVEQLTPSLFKYSIDDSRDKISEDARLLIKTKFEEIFIPASGK
ncbi:MAG: hypothetical protein ABJA70_15595 [Chryseolinea sp.]